MKKTICLVLFCLNLYSQSFFHSKYSWDKNPKVYTPTESEKKHERVVVTEKKIYEIAYEADGQAVIYETIHNRYHLNGNKAIDNANKGYMSLANVLEEIDLKARCITSDNKVIYFNKATLKSVDNLDGAGPFKLFAIDGVDSDCDIEIIYTNKKQFFSYASYAIKANSPIVHFESRVISPKNLVFESKTYNGLESFKSDDSDTTKNQLILIHSNIEAVQKEKYSANVANSMSFIFQLAYNTDKKKTKTYNWDVISQDFYNSLYSLEKSESKAIDKIVEKNKFAKFASRAEKIKSLDSYFKTNFEISENYSELKLEKSLEAKKINTTNGLKFYLGALKSLQIPFELVITTDRNDLVFDGKFPSYVYMDEFLIYFPEEGKYVSPMSLYSRFGFPSPDLLNNDGLFIKEVSIGDISSSTSKIKRIAPTGYKDSYHNTNVTANIDLEKKEVYLDVAHSIQGYSCYYIQPIYRYLTNEQKTEVNKNYHLSANSEGIKNLTFTNTAEEDLFVKPMIVNFNSYQNDFLENAGDKFILKVGLLIGPQAELYQEEKRKWPGEMNYPHYLMRILEINIPKGYKPTNLNDLIIEKTCIMDGNEIASFKSVFETKDNKIIITVYEDYRVMNYPLSIFDTFKAVLNAAADFNKKSIIFVKE